MAKQPWKYLSNTFYARTWNSMKTALILTQDHVAKLTANEADAEILAIKTDYLPLHNAFVTAQIQLDSKLGIYKGQTQTFEEMLAELGKEKINQWRGQVFAVFPEGTPNATAIFPRDRQPFQKDTYDERVEAVEALSVTLATYTGNPALVTLSATVHAYYITLSGARALQQTDEGSTETLRTNLKAAHKMMCDGMYRNLGLLMAKYYQAPLTVADYFELSLIRETGDDDTATFSGPIAATAILNLNEQIDETGIDVGPETEIRFTNTSTLAAVFIFYLADSATGAPGPGPQFVVLPGETLVKTAGELNVPGFNFVNVKNNSPHNGTWTLELIA